MTVTPAHAAAPIRMLPHAMSGQNIVFAVCALAVVLEIGLTWRMLRH